MKQSEKKIFSIPGKSKSGSEWDKFSFAEFTQRYKQEGKSYGISPTKYLRSLYRAIISEMGKIKGGSLFFKTIMWDMTINKPKWLPGKFNIASKEQEIFYNEKFKELVPLIVFNQTLGRTIGTERADRLLAYTTLPLVLEMMNKKYTPVENMSSIEIFLQQTRNYLGREWEENKGFSGDVYLADDKSELWFHVTRCAPMQILREYGLHFTATAFCMCDHITYHTLFPNLIFKRSHNLASGDDFCDLEFRIRKKSDPIMDEDNYSDCMRDPEMREFVREWEEKAKKMFFGSNERWHKYANKFMEVC